MRLARNSTLRVAVALLIGLLCLWLSLRGVPLAVLRDQMLRVSPSLVALAALCVVLVAAGKALRWQWLYGAGVPARPWLTHFAILMIGQMLNLVIPIRIGELARLGLMRQEERPLGVTFGTIVVEKALDLLALGLIVLLAVPLARAMRRDVNTVASALLGWRVGSIIASPLLPTTGVAKSSGKTSPTLRLSQT